MRLYLNKKLVTMLVAIIVFGLLVSGCGQNTQQNTANTPVAPSTTKSNDGVVTLKLAHHLASDDPVNIELQKFAQSVEQKTNGKVKIALFPGSQLGSEKQVLEGVKSGTIDIGMGDHAYLSNFVPSYGLLDMPFLYSDYNQLGKVLDGPAVKTMDNALLQKEGLRNLGWFFIGFRYFLTSKPIMSISDFKGMKIRAPEAPVYIDTLKALGSNPTPIAWGEVYTSLQTHVVEGVEGAPMSLYSAKFYEVSKYMTKTNHIQVSIAPIINEKKWQSLKPEYQKAIQDALAPLIAEERANAEKINNDDAKLIEQKGVKVYDIDKKPLIEAVKPIWAQYAQKNNCTDLLDQIVKMTQ